MLLLKRLSTIHILMMLNLMMFGISAWSNFQPSKAWLVSQSSEQRYIASFEEAAPKEKNFEKMESFPVNCEELELSTESKYISFQLGNCVTRATLVSLKNLSTGTSANVFVDENYHGTDFIFLKEGQNLIEYRVKDTETGASLVKQIKVSLI